MSKLKFEISGGNPSDEASNILSYLNSNHAEAMGKIATAVHVSEAEAEIGACLGSVEHFTVGEKESVSIPVCGTDSHPSVYAHTQPIMKWKPSERDIEQTATRGSQTRGFVTLTTNGLESVFGSITALPKEINKEILDSDLSGPQLRSRLRDEGHLVKITSKNPPDVTDEAIRSAVESGLLDRSYLD